MTQILEHLFSNLTLWSFKPVSFVWTSGLTERYWRYRFEGLIFGGALLGILRYAMNDRF